MKIYRKENPQILNDFLDYLHKIKNYSINTIQSYNLDLLCFFNFLKSYLGLDTEVKEFNTFILVNVKESDIIAFLVYLNFHKDNTGATRQRKLAGIRCFYKWLFRTHPACAGKKDPTKEIPNIRQVVRLPKYLTLEQAKKISSIFTLENSIYPLRNNTIITLFLNTGMRVSELCGLNVEDINFDEMYIKITGKRNKVRKIPINKKTKTQLLKYLKFKNKGKKIVSLSGPVFINHQNKRLGVDGIEDVCKKAFKLMELEEYGYTAHTLRHTAATIIYQYVKSDVLLLKAILGHESIETTRIYTHVHDDKIRDAFDRNPLNNFSFQKIA